MQEGKYPEFKMPDIYPAFFNPAKCCLPNSTILCNMTLMTYVISDRKMN